MPFLVYALCALTAATCAVLLFIACLQGQRVSRQVDQRVQRPGQ